MLMDIHAITIPDFDTVWILLSQNLIQLSLQFYPGYKVLKANFSNEFQDWIRAGNK